MPKSSKQITPSGGFLHELALRIKLILRLMGDSRVNPLLKLLPVASVLYIINPIDVPGPLDDAAVVGLGMYLFMELCPPEVVQEHLEKLRNVDLDSGAGKGEDEIVDAEFHEEDPDS